jgi:NitT/TauT family transport system substrate-binding protein
MALSRSWQTGPNRPAALDTIPYMISRRHSLAVALFTGLFGLSATACTSTSVSATMDMAQENPNVVVAEVPTTSAAGLYIAAQEGFFKAAGLNVTIKPVASLAGITPELLNGSVQVELGQWTTAITAEAGGAQFHALAAANSSGPGLTSLVTAPGSKITRLGQLRGKKVLVNAKGGLAQMLAESVLEDASVQPSQTDYVTAPFPSIAAALEHGAADAAVLPEPFLTQAEEKWGMATLADLNQGGVTDFPLAGYVSTSSWAQKNPAVAAAFVQALAQGQVVASTDRPVVEQVLQHNLGMTGIVTSVMALGTYPISINAAQLSRVGYLMQRFGMLSPSANVNSLISAMIR